MLYEVATAGQPSETSYWTTDLATAIIEMMARYTETGLTQCVYSSDNELVASSFAHSGDTVVFAALGDEAPDHFMVSRQAAFPILDQLGVRLTDLGVAHTLLLASI